MSAHTPTPWSTEQRDLWWVIFAEGTHVASGERAGLAVLGDGTQDQRQANAEFIVRACNSHDDLVNALNFAEAWIVAATKDFRARSEGTLHIIRAALTKAGAP